MKAILLAINGLAIFGLVRHYTQHACIAFAVIFGLNYILLGIEMIIRKEEVQK